MAELARLRELMRRLRAPDGGCPWDRQQTFGTIVPHTLEEAYEVADAIETGRLADLAGELGDLLFQIVFYCQLADERGLFDFDEVARRLATKLEQRHPHVFGAASDTDAASVNRRWEALKADERRRRAGPGPASELDDVPPGLPALTRAQKLQKRAARVGFDWPDVGGAWDKLVEETGEVRAALDAGAGAALDDELGDLLFALVNVCRHLGRDAETLLRGASRKFERRFRYIEQALAGRGLVPGEADAATLDALWCEAKALDGERA
jgi:MazG family protein